MSNNESIRIQLEQLDTPRKLSQAVVQAADMLGLLGAELASILGLLCSDISKLRSGVMLLAADTLEGRQAMLFLRLYQKIYRQHNGDGVAMRHWLRTENRDLGGVPVILMVDEKKLEHVLNCEVNAGRDL